MARPIQTNPDEMMEEFLVPDHQKNYSKRDKARQQFIAAFRKKKAIRSSLKNTVTVELERMKDFEEGSAALKEMKYDQLVEELNKDRQAIGQIDRPLQLYKTEQEVQLAR